ncbi:hypothetical protein J5X84_21440 [Streptosporangiaceae bacterium NEAU-GS5]|nr:hypothetical protein [Streptosporangiaceae bacterium NEAU-GS5]
MTSSRLTAVACAAAAMAFIMSAAVSGCASLTRTLGADGPVSSPSGPVPEATVQATPSAPSSVPEASPPSSAFRPSPSASPSVEPATCVVGKWRLGAWLEVVNTSTWDPKATGTVTLQAIADDNASLGTLTLGKDGKGTQTLDAELTGEIGAHSYTAAFHGTAKFSYAVSGSTVTYAQPSGAFTAELTLDGKAAGSSTVPPSTKPYELICTNTTLALRAPNYVYAFARS